MGWPPRLEQGAGAASWLAAWKGRRLRVQASKRPTQRQQVDLLCAVCYEGPRTGAVPATADQHLRGLPYSRTPELIARGKLILRRNFLPGRELTNTNARSDLVGKLLVQQRERSSSMRALSQNSQVVKTT